MNTSSLNFEQITNILIQNHKYFFSKDPNHLPIFIFDNVGALKLYNMRFDKKNDPSLKWSSDFVSLIKFAERGIRTHSFKSILIDNSLSSYLEAINISFLSYLIKLNIFPELTYKESISYMKCISSKEKILDDSITSVYKSIGGNFDHISAFIDIKKSYSYSIEIPILNNENILTHIIEMQAQKYFEELGMSFTIGSKFSKNLNFFELNNKDIKRMVDTMILIKKIVNEMKELEINDEIESLIYEEIFHSPIFIKYWKNGKKYINFQSTIFLEYAKMISGFNDSNQKNIYENQIEFLNSKKSQKCKCKKLI